MDTFSKDPRRSLAYQQGYEQVLHYLSAEKEIGELGSQEFYAGFAWAEETRDLMGQDYVANRAWEAGESPGEWLANFQHGCEEGVAAFFSKQWELYLKFKKPLSKEAQNTLRLAVLMSVPGGTLQISPAGDEAVVSGGREALEKFQVDLQEICQGPPEEEGAN